MADDKHIVRTAGFDWSRGWGGKHPFNPASEMTMLPLGRPTGMQRIGVNLIRIPPGKESFIPHAHSISEEFVFVVEGRGEAVLDQVLKSKCAPSKKLLEHIAKVVQDQKAYVLLDSQPSR